MRNEKWFLRGAWGMVLGAILFVDMEMVYM